MNKRLGILKENKWYKLTVTHSSLMKHYLNYNIRSGQPRNAA